MSKWQNSNWLQKLKFPSVLTSSGRTPGVGSDQIHVHVTDIRTRRAPWCRPRSDTHCWRGRCLRSAAVRQVMSLSGRSPVVMVTEWLRLDIRHKRHLKHIFYMHDKIITEFISRFFIKALNFCNLHRSYLSGTRTQTFLRSLISVY